MDFFSRHHWTQAGGVNNRGDTIWYDPASVIPGFGNAPPNHRSATGMVLFGEPREENVRGHVGQFVGMYVAINVDCSARTYHFVTISYQPLKRDFGWEENPPFPERPIPPNTFPAFIVQNYCH